MSPLIRGSFSIVNTIALQDPQLVESADAEPQIGRNQVYRQPTEGQVRHRFLTASKPRYTIKNPKVIMFSLFVGRKTLGTR